MQTLKFQNVSFSYPTGKPILDAVTMSMPQAVYAVAGKNGTGKTTLLKLAAGILSPQQGDISVSFGGSLCYLQQDIINPLAQESAGEQKAAALARTFREQGATLFLDEPETHIDARQRSLLKNRIRRHRGLILIVSHDRQILDLASSILHLEQGKLTKFSMPYSEYRDRCEEIRATTEATVREEHRLLERQQRDLQVDLERQLRRNANAARKAPLAGIPRVARGLMKRNAEKTLGKIISRSGERLAKTQARLSHLNKTLPRVRTFSFAAAPANRIRMRLEVSQLEIHLPGNQPLWPDTVNFSATAGERIFVAGENGSGKSCLFSAIAGKPRLSHTGTINFGKAKVHLIDSAFFQINREVSLLELARRCMRDAEDTLRRLLGAYGYAGDTVFQRFCSLSCGEQMRLYLFLLTHSQLEASILLFDEMETGLDSETRHVVAEFVLKYPGIVIYATHDPDFAVTLQPQQTITLRRVWR